MGSNPILVANCCVRDGPREQYGWKDEERQVRQPSPLLRKKELKDIFEKERENKKGEKEIFCFPFKGNSGCPSQTLCLCVLGISA